MLVLISSKLSICNGIILTQYAINYYLCLLFRLKSILKNGNRDHHNDEFMTMTVHIILNIQWHWRRGQTSLKNKWRRHTIYPSPLMTPPLGLYNLNSIVVPPHWLETTFCILRALIHVYIGLKNLLSEFQILTTSLV